ALGVLPTAGHGVGLSHVDENYLTERRAISSLKEGSPKRGIVAVLRRLVDFRPVFALSPHASWRASTTTTSSSRPATCSRRSTGGSTRLPRTIPTRRRRSSAWGSAT